MSEESKTGDGADKAESQYLNKPINTVAACLKGMTGTRDDGFAVVEFNDATASGAFRRRSSEQVATVSPLPESQGCRMIVSGLDEDGTKNRLQIFVERKTNGDSTKLQALCKSVVELAQSTKHNRQTATRKSAGIAADSVIMLANILRRLDS